MRFSSVFGTFPHGHSAKVHTVLIKLRSYQLSHSYHHLVGWKIGNSPGEFEGKIEETLLRRSIMRNKKCVEGFQNSLVISALMEFIGMEKKVLRCNREQLGAVFLPY